MIRVSEKGIKPQCPSVCRKKGNQYSKNPSKKINSVRRRIFPITAPWDIVSNFFMPKLRALPTANKKEGKTRSVGVKPCQWAWLRGQYESASEPGSLTMIMKHTVIPRNMSRANDLWEVAVISGR